MKESLLLHGNRPFAICPAADIGLEQQGALLLDEDIALRLKFSIRQIQYVRLALSNHKTRSVGFTRATVQIVDNRGQPGRSVAFSAKVVRDLFQITGAEALGDSTFMYKLKHEEKKEEKEQEKIMKTEKEKKEMKKVNEQEEMMKKVMEKEVLKKVPSIVIKRTPWKVRKNGKFSNIPYKRKVVKVGGVLMAQDIYSSDDSASDATQFSVNDCADDCTSDDSNGYIHKEYDKDTLCLPSDDSDDCASEEYDSSDGYIRKEYNSDTLCLPSDDSDGDGYIYKDYDSDTLCLRECPSVDTSEAKQVGTNEAKLNNNRGARRGKLHVRKVRAGNIQWWKQVRDGITKEDLEAEDMRRDERLRTRESDDLLDKAFPGGAKLAHGLVKRWEEEVEEKLRQKRTGSAPPY